MCLTVDIMALWSDHNKLEINGIYIETFFRVLLPTIADTNIAFMTLILIPLYTSPCRGGRKECISPLSVSDFDICHNTKPDSFNFCIFILPEPNFKSTRSPLASNRTFYLHEDKYSFLCTYS